MNVIWWYKWVLYFTAIYSYIVYGLQFIDYENSSRKWYDLFIYFTNWTFTLFLISITINVFRLLSSKEIPTRLQWMIYYIGTITKPIYISICILYTISLIDGYDILSAYNFNEKTNFQKTIFYINDISKHFVFVFLLIALFILDSKPSITYLKNVDTFHHYLYPIGFFYIYLIFSAFYKANNKILIYNISPILLTLIVIFEPLVLFLIHTALYYFNIKLTQMWIIYRYNIEKKKREI